MALSTIVLVKRQPVFTSSSLLSFTTLTSALSLSRFCVSIISAPFATSANYTSIDAPPSVSEWELSGLTPVPSETWGDENGPPRVGESPYTLECELYREVEITNDGGEKTASL